MIVVLIGKTLKGVSVSIPKDGNDSLYTPRV